VGTIRVEDRVRVSRGEGKGRRREGKGREEKRVKRIIKEATLYSLMAYSLRRPDRSTLQSAAHAYQTYQEPRSSALEAYRPAARMAC